jgi:glycosyltransferase involved in cell wall biosynthesis
MDLGFISSPEHFLKKDLHQLTSWTNYSIANAAKVITISEFTRREVIGHYGKSSESVVSIPLGYNSSLFKVHQKADIQIPRELGITSPYILFLSSLKPSKNVVRLVQAFNLVSQDYPDLKLVIAGKKAWLFEEIFSEVVRLGLEDKVIFTGFIKDALKPVLMAASKVFVMPSLYEGFSITLLEAMACGVPVVASNIPSQVEVAGTACILVDPLDSTSIASGIIQALGPKGDASAKLGLARVKLFDWSKTAKLTLGVIESACKK